MAFSSRRRCCCFITLVLLLFTSLVSSEDLDVLIPYVDTTQIPEEYFDWPLYHPLKFDVSWNEKPEAIIQGYISGATSIWSEALQVYPQEQPLRIETPACSEVLTDTTSFEGPDIVLFISLTQDTDKCHNKPVMGSPCAYHPVTKRPNAGILHFCTSILPQLDESMILQETVQQIGSILGLNPRLYSNFINTDTRLFQSPSPVTIPGCTRVFLPSPQTIWESKLVTPLALQVMRNHLDCQSLSGIDLVQDFCLGEPKLLWNQHQHSSTHPTHFVLALLEDSGWYAANYDVAVPSATGFGQGCDYLQSLSEDECPECTADVVSMPCDSSHYTVTPCASDCPVAIDCYSSAVGLAMTGGTFGAASRCFDTIDQQQRGMCLETKCDNGGNAVVVVNDKE